MRKSFSKRIRITKRGKIVRRSMAINHFRTRKSTNNIRHKRRTRSLDLSMKQLIH